MKHKSILDRRENKPIYNKSNGLCKACGINPMRERGYFCEGCHKQWRTQGGDREIEIAQAHRAYLAERARGAGPMGYTVVGRKTKQTR